MTAKLAGIEFDALDSERLARFWSKLLGRRLCGLEISDGASTSQDGQRLLVNRAIKLGARHVDVGQRTDEPHTVLADPEGNEFCVVEPGNGFLSNTDLIGAVNCAGTQVLGYFWSAALKWPLVWDQAQETAIQSPHGGSKLTWSGPPLMPRSGRDRLRLIVTAASGDGRTEQQRLISLGASAVNRVGDRATILVDPDGNEFVLAHTR